MSASWNLHCLYSLDPSSPVFLRRLHSLFCFDEGEQYLFGLQGSELTRLLDFLDHVCTLLSTFRPATKQALQTLGALPPNDDISIQCLRKLQAICSYHAALPSSYFASGEISRVGDHPIVVGGISDVWEGTYRNKRVSIEHLKISPNDDQVLKEVRVLYGKRLVRVGLGIPVRSAVVHRTGSHVETAKTPKYRPLRWDHDESVADHFEVDAKRNSDGFCRGKSGREPDQPCKSLPACA